MAYVIVLLLGLFAGAFVVFVIQEQKRKAVAQQKRDQDARQKDIVESLRSLTAEREKLAEQSNQVIAFSELQGENTLLKRDLQNIDVNLSKLQLDRDLQREKQETVDQRSNTLAARFLKDNIKWIRSSLNANNFAQCKERLAKAMGWCRSVGFEIPTKEEREFQAELREEYERKVRAVIERDEQARIRAQIREEQKLEREIKEEQERLERERAVISAALEEALADAKDEHSAEIESLRDRLREAEEQSQRAVSRAQLTKSGHVYVISNIGSFGEGVYKVGLTRRLEPLERVKELGDASVPFPFDVHMMIASDNAPTLENALHRQLHRLRVNKANPRKEFFRADLDAIRDIVTAHHGEVEYVADAEALEYRQSLAMSDDDLEVIEHAFDRASQAIGDDEE